MTEIKPIVRIPELEEPEGIKPYEGDEDEDLDGDFTEDDEEDEDEEDDKK